MSIIFPYIRIPTLDVVIKKFISFLLCVSVTFCYTPFSYADITYVGDGMSEAEIKARYPDAKIIHTTQKEYPEVARQLRDQGYALQQESSTGSSVNYSNDCNQSSGRNPQTTDDTIRMGVEITDDILDSAGNSSNNKLAAIVFVIIGTIVVVVWAIYVFKYMYDLASGFRPCFPWYEFTLSSSSTSSKSIKQLDLTGLRFMTGFSDENTDVGIALELGESDIKFTDTDSVNFGGNYWMLGPVLRWHLNKELNPHTFQMSFMGGSTQSRSVDLLARANIGVQFSLSNSFHLGFSWGVMNIELNSHQGIITERDEYEYFFGINSGVQF